MLVGVLAFRLGRLFRPLLLPPLGLDAIGGLVAYLSGRTLRRQSALLTS